MKTLWNSDIDYIMEYSKHFDTDDLPVWINAENAEEVNQACKECLDKGKSYSELFGEVPYDSEAIY